MCNEATVHEIPTKKKRCVGNKSHINNAGIDSFFHNESNSRDVFETKQKIWINSAIKKVQNTLLKYLRSSRKLDIRSRIAVSKIDA